MSHRALEQVLSFENARLDECLIESFPFHVDFQMTGDSVQVRPNLGTKKESRIQGSHANIFGQKFSSRVRKYYQNILPEHTFEFMFDYQITFKSANSIWKFQFGYVPREAFIEYKTRDPSLRGTILLKKEAGPELESLIISILTDKAETNE
ncbi:MAG: hypothetical protein ACYS8Y_08630 [Planctomycetota bacterium]